jgi:Tol biopolymer transport system component
MRRLILATMLAGAALAPAAAQAVPDGGVELISRPTGFGPLPFDGVSYATVGPHAMSADGCKVAFQSNNDALSTLDDDVAGDIFVVDRCAPGQPVTLASATAGGTPADGSSHSPSISADGKRVAFTTAARNLVPPGTAVGFSVVVKDLPSGDVILASQGNGTSGKAAETYGGVISGDGKAVAFEGIGEIDAVNAKGTSDDIYVRFLGGAQTVMATAKGAVPGGTRGYFDISDDGSRVVFTSNTAFVAGDGDSYDDAYIVAITPAGSVTQRLASGTQIPDEVAISGDGQTVAFAGDRVWVASCATDPCGAPAQVDGAPANSGQRIRGLDFPAAPAAAGLVSWTTDRALLPADTNARNDLYAASLSPAPQVVLPFGPAAGGTGLGSISGDLSVVVTESPSLDLPGTDGVHRQVFARSNGTTAVLSQPAGEPVRRSETDGSRVARGGVSENGRLVAMETESPALGAPLLQDAKRRTVEIAVRDVLTGVTSLVSVGPDGAPGDGSSESPRVDAAGSRVVFTSAAANLTPGVTAAPGLRHVYVRDLATGTTQLVDRNPDGSPISVGATTAVISDDGTKVAFISGSPDLPGPGTGIHAYVADLATGAITLVDQTAAGQPADSSSYEVVLDGDGSRAAFTSSASNLGAAGNGDKVFLKDLSSGQVTYVSVPESGTPEQGAEGLSIDAAGDHVAWDERTATFGYGSDGHAHVFVRDVPAGVTTLGSAGGGPAGSDDFGGELDASGSRLAFVSGSEDVPPYVFRPYLRDLATGVMTSLLPNASQGGYDIGLSPDGVCAAVTSESPGVLADNPSPDFEQVYLRAVGGACAPRPDAGQPGAGAADTTPPVISGLRMTRSRFAVRKRASAFVFRLSEDSRASVAIARCVKLRKRTCRRYRVVATLTRAHAKQGRNRIAFSGRIGKRKLRRGRYRATVGAIDAAGNRGVPRRVHFTIIRR